MMADSTVDKVAKAMEAKRMELITRPLSLCFGEMAHAAIEVLADEDPAKVFWQDWAAKRLEISRNHWMQAAKAALDRGDMRGLRLRVDQIEAPPAQIVGSESPTPTERESV